MRTSKFHVFFFVRVVDPGPHLVNKSSLVVILDNGLSARIYPAFSTLVEIEVLPVFVTFNNASLSLNILNSSPSEDLIPSVHVSVLLIFSKC